MTGPVLPPLAADGAKPTRHGHTADDPKSSAGARPTRVAFSRALDDAMPETDRDAPMVMPRSVKGGAMGHPIDDDAPPRASREPRGARTRAPKDDASALADLALLAVGAPVVDARPPPPPRLDDDGRAPGRDRGATVAELGPRLGDAMAAPSAAPTRRDVALAPRAPGRDAPRAPLVDGGDLSTRAPRSTSPTSPAVASTIIRVALEDSLLAHHLNAPVAVSEDPATARAAMFARAGAALTSDAAPDPARVRDAATPTTPAATEPARAEAPVEPTTATHVEPTTTAAAPPVAVAASASAAAPVVVTSAGAPTMGPLVPVPTALAGPELRDGILDAVRITPREVNVELTLDDGKAVALRIAIEDGVAHVTASGVGAGQVAQHQRELESVFLREGLRLGGFTLDHGGERAPDERPDALETPRASSAAPSTAARAEAADGDAAAPASSGAPGRVHVVA